MKSSVVVTLVQVIHSDTTWPANKLRMKFFVHILANRAQRVLKNTEGESNRTSGREISSAFAGWVGSTVSSNLDGTGEVDSCLVAFERPSPVVAIRVLGEGSGQRDDSGPGGKKLMVLISTCAATKPIKIEADLLLVWDTCGVVLSIWLLQLIHQPCDLSTYGMGGEA